ncbi:MAG: hypothetical protein ABW152_14285 [Candidatus Thiodiazotropha endolucinida]
MGISIRLSLASEYGKRIVGEVRQEASQGKTRGRECCRRANRETRKALSASAGVDVQTSLAP